MRLPVLLMVGAILAAGPLMAKEAVQDVSIIQLVASPEKYEGKAIRVFGFLRLEFEGNGLYLHREDYEKALYKNGLWVQLPMTGENQKCNLKYVLIEGTFDSKDQGHLGLWSGAIKDVKRLELWGPDRDSPKQGK